MKYRYTISATGNADEKSINECLEKIGLTDILVDKTSDPSDWIQLLSNEPKEDILNTFQKMLDSGFITNTTLKHTLDEYDRNRIKSLRDIGVAVSECCDLCDLSNAYKSLIIERIATEKF